MNKSVTSIFLTLLFILLSVSIVYGDDNVSEYSKKFRGRQFGSPASYYLYPIKLDSENDIATFELGMTHSMSKSNLAVCGEIEVEFLTDDNLVFLGSDKWRESFLDKDTVYKTIQIKVPKDTISSFQIKYTCVGTGHSKALMRYYFTNTDSLYFTLGSPKKFKPEKRQKEPTREDFTEEELDIEYEISVMFKDSVQMSKFEEITNIKPKPDNKNVIFIKLKLRTLIELGESNFEFGFISEPPWPKSWPPRIKKPVDSKPIDSTKPQGNINDFKSQSYASGFSLESVDNLLY